MALKDVNILEKHAEKMVLGAAAAGALFMGYLATQKITTENDVAPNQVQASIQKRIFGDPELGRPRKTQRRARCSSVRRK